ncbi:MAG: transglutaminase family protein [Rhodoferax sp.]|nr:transglutaminase family protein [Rhodoferax sp.]
MSTEESFETAVHHHDANVAALGLDIWVGSEPTFTDRNAQTPPWLNIALGADKELRAQALLRDLSVRMQGGMVLRSVGRLYPGEKIPRWNFGLLRFRSARSLWNGPPDPLQLSAPERYAVPDIPGWAHAMARAFSDQHRITQCTESNEQAGAPVWRLVVEDCESGAEPLVFVLSTLEVQRPSEADTRRYAALALPAIGSVQVLLSVLACIEHAALDCGLQALVFTGVTPPVDAELELTTVTPDPAVIEVNTAPSRCCAEFLWRSRQVYAVATAQSLAPYRLYFNGQVADSGGAGQITLGGPSPDGSPFIKNPKLLAQWVRFLNRHPALSYLFAHDFVGSSGQSVRPDERGTDAFDDLVLALALLERQVTLAPELLWSSLSSFLCDAVGNSHRAEINIEKLWNPHLPGRGCLGLVEFRSLRMQHTPERATAIACLLRAVTAMLATCPITLPLIDWGRQLHDRFALPFYLRADLDEVLLQLDRAGLGLGAAIEEVLRQNGFRFFGRVVLPFGTLELWRALEFWPLVGDAASPEQTGSSRMVDSSTARIEVRWIAPSPEAASEDANADGNWHDWNLYADGVRIPWRTERDSQGALKVFGIRYRSFVPRCGLHPTLPVQTPLTLTLRHTSLASAYVVQLHEWHPQGLAYAGLPESLEEARARRADRITVQKTEEPLPPSHDKADSEAGSARPGLSRYCLDLRYGGVRGGASGLLSPG